MPHALRSDARLNAALLITHFCWRELHDLLVTTDDVRDLRRLPEGDALARRVLERALECIPHRPQLLGLVTRRFDLVHERFLDGWRELPDETRRLAVQRPNPADFLRRGLDPAALLWAVATDPDPEIRDQWPGVVRGCFPELSAHLEL
ncbi:MAG: hypothetical protein AAFZ65_14075 [Planctomycetota bacterium]